MDNKKFEQLIDLIINENEEQARELFHEIVVEKSREIYESIMDEEMDEGMGGQVGEMMDEISAEESGMTEEEEMDMDDLGDDEAEVVDIDADDMGSEEEEHEEIEDAVVRIEDKLDQLMAEFEELMGHEEEEAGDEEEDFGDEEEEAGDEEEEAGEEMMEAVQLKKVSVTHGDNGAQTKSTVAANAGQAGMASKPVKFAGDAEAVPTSPKSPSNAYSKGETEVKGAGKFKNAPAQASQDLEKAPAPKKGDDGANTKSPLGESKKVSKKIVK